MVAVKDSHRIGRPGEAEQAVEPKLALFPVAPEVEGVIQPGIEKDGREEEENDRRDREHGGYFMKSGAVALPTNIKRSQPYLSH